MRILAVLDSVIKNPALDPKLGDISRDIGRSSEATLQAFLVSGVNLALGVGGIITFFMLLVGAVEYITSGGDKENTEKAKKKLTAALVGLILLLSTYAIVKGIEGIFGINLLNFSIPVISNS